MSRHAYYRHLRNIGFSPIEAFQYIKGRPVDFKF